MWVPYEGSNLATKRLKTDEVLAAARKDLQAQLAIVREEMSRVVAEESALTAALSGLNGAGTSSSSAASASKGGGRVRVARASATRGPARKAGSGRRRRARGASKSTADRVEALQMVLVDGPKSRSDLAAALKVSPARVQQLLAELGSAVSSRTDPGQRRGKLWSLKGNGASAAKPSAKRSSARPKRGSARKPSGEKAAAGK